MLDDHCVAPLSRHDWARMLDRLAVDPALSPTQHRVLTVILRHVGSKDRDLTQTTIANEVGRSRRTITDVTRWLVTNGYLLVTKQSDAHGYRTASTYAPGPVSTGQVEPPKRSQTATKAQKTAQQKRETTTPSPGQGVGQTKGLVQEKAFVEQATSSTRTSCRAREATPLACPVGAGAESVEAPALPQVSPSPHREEQAHAIPPHPFASAMSAIETVLGRLERVRHNGPHTLASCPVASHGKGNGDREPSLSITEKDGLVLLHCMAGCETQDVMIAAGLDWPDLFDRPPVNDRGVKVAEWVYQKSDGSPYLIVERWQKAHGKRFIQRIPGADRAGTPAGFPPALFKLPKVLAAAKAHEEIYVVEGEKCVAAAERLGVVATTAPGGASRQWEDYYAKWLQGASRVTIVTDNDEPGMRHAAEVAASMKLHKIPARTMQVAVTDAKADLYDHVLAGFGLADLKPIRLNRLHPQGTTLNRLLTGDFPPVKWIIPDLLPIGLTMLGGAPKVGKSMIALDIALAVAHGGYALYGPKVNQGSVLYLSLDNDDEGTLAARARHLSARVGYPNDGPMEILTEYPVSRDAIAAISEWIEIEREEDRNPLFVVADTLARIEPEYEGSVKDRSLYAGATATMARWSALADRAQIGIMFVHHTHKQQAGERSKGADWMNLFMGSQGLAAGCKNLMMVQHQRGTDEAYLLTDSRHCDGQELLMKRDGWGWGLFDQITSRPAVQGKAGMRLLPGGKQ